MSIKLNYFYQFDVLRAFAVILVIISHWFGPDHFLNHFKTNGIIGVTLFFVLSGYLITNILLRYKDEIGKKLTRLHALKIFYVRRALRIFPIYYMILGLMYLLNLPSVRDSVFWHIFYCSNFYYFKINSWEGPASHFWSLSVEEQFYIVWPVLIIYTAKKNLYKFLFAGVIIGISYRIFISYPENEMSRILLPGSVDSFCIGGLFALMKIRQFKYYTFCLKNQTIVILHFIVFFTFLQSNIFKVICGDNYIAFYIFFISLIFGLFIDFLSRKKVKQNHFWKSSALIFTGKISYGLYLFHNFIPYMKVFDFPNQISINYYSNQLIRFILLFAIASISWFLIERPILKYKDKFNY
jgi:peptidoglycan/LPS O-acetylase OafA/YrhL